MGTSRSARGRPGSAGRPDEWDESVTVSGTRRDSQYPPVSATVVKLAKEFPVVPALALFRAVGRARRAVAQAGPLHPAHELDEIERLARDELRRWRPAHPLVTERQFPMRNGWHYGR